MSRTPTVLYVAADDRDRSVVADELDTTADASLTVDHAPPDTALDVVTQADCLVSGRDCAVDGVPFAVAAADVGFRGPHICFDTSAYETLCTTMADAPITDCVRRTGEQTQYAVLADRIRRGLAGARQDVGATRAREQVLVQLHETTRTLMHLESPTEIAQEAVNAVEEILGYSVTGIRLYDREHQTLDLVAVSESTTETLGPRPTYGAEHGGIVWEAFVSGEPMVYDDVDRIDDAYDRSGVESAMYVPIGRLGTLSVASDRPAAFDDEKQQFMQLLVANVEAAFGRAMRTRLLRKREDELARQNARLEEFASVVSHDLRNPLSVARGFLELAADADDPDEAAAHFERVEDAHERINRLITDLLSLARQGQTVGDTEPVSLTAVTQRAWNAVATADATLVVAGERRLVADEERLLTLFENLFRNAVQHGGDDVTVTVGGLEDGFFVEDDGPGITDVDADRVFERGYTTGTSSTGFGLSIVEGIAGAHGWDVRVAAADGARFEVVGVDRPKQSDDER